jgi:hypothetical protein
MKTMKTNNFQELEKFLRDNNFDTYLFATKPTKYHVMYLKNELKNDLNALRPEVPEYECIFSCRPKPYALEEVLMNWKSYEENFIALGTSGVASLQSDTNLLDDPSTYVFTEKEKSIAEKLMDCEVLISIEKIDPNDFLISQSEIIRKRTGEVPSHVKIGSMPPDTEIFGLFVENKLASPYGYSITYKNNEKFIAIVDVGKMFE